MRSAGQYIQCAMWLGVNNEGIGMCPVCWVQEKRVGKASKKQHMSQYNNSRSAYVCPQCRPRWLYAWHARRKVVVKYSGRHESSTRRVSYKPDRMHRNEEPKIYMYGAVSRTGRMHANKHECRSRRINRQARRNQKACMSSEPMAMVGNCC